MYVHLRKSLFNKSVTKYPIINYTGIGGNNNGHNLFLTKKIKVKTLTYFLYEFL